MLFTTHIAIEYNTKSRKRGLDQIQQESPLDAEVIAPSPVLTLDPPVTGYLNSMSPSDPEGLESQKLFADDLMFELPKLELDFESLQQYLEANSPHPSPAK